MRNQFAYRDLRFPRLGGMRAGALPPAGTAAKFQNVNADGWSVDYSAPPTFNPSGSPEYFTVTRAGYNSSAAPIAFTEDLVCTQRIRQPYPNHASLTTDQVAVSDFIYSTDTVLGATNGSTEVSPKPVANWALPGNQLVGNTVHLELVAFHRDGRSGEQVAAVEFRATDGTTTVTQVVGSSSILGHSGDRFPVIGYACDLDISTLANPATITVNAKVFPHVGGAASVRDSADNSGLRAFAPLKFRRDTAIAAAPRYAYVGAGGNDSTGAISTTAATAKAAPCATIAGAINRAVTVNGSCDGLVIRLLAGSQQFVTSAISTTRALSEGAEVIIERDPDSARSACISYLQASGSRPRLGANGGQLRWRDVTVQRESAVTSIYGETASHLALVVENCDFNNNNASGTLLNQNSSLRWLGATITNAVAGFTTANATLHHLMWRGVQMGSGNVEAWLMLGCDFTAIAAPFYGSKAQSGIIAAFNRFRGYTNGFTFSNVPDGAAIVQNIFECTGAAVTSTMQFADGGPLTHIMMHHNVVTGFFSVGRNNLFYDQTSAPATSKLMSMRGNIHGQINNKGDRFDSNGALTGNWSYLYGVGCYGEFSMFIDANSSGIGGSFAQAYPGLGAKIGTSSTVRQDPLFVDYKGVTSGPTAGAGGGNYALQSGSPAKAMLSKTALKYDMAGAARSLTAASAGAYE